MAGVGMIWLFTVLGVGILGMKFVVDLLDRTLDNEDIDLRAAWRKRFPR